MNLQDYWKKGKIPGISGITFSNGCVLLNKSNQCQASYDFSISSIKDNEIKYGEIGVEVDIYIEKKINNSDRSILCGGCEMGNEGFVLYRDEFGVIKWSLFQDFANPFLNDLKVVNGVIFVNTEIQYYWEIPILSPEKLSCVSRNEWGY